MRIFKHSNFGESSCPICNKKTDKEVVLIGIDGTEDGRIIEAAQVHLDCLELRVNKEKRIIYQIYE
jgi:hypothetical protein